MMREKTIRAFQKGKNLIEIRFTKNKKHIPDQLILSISVSKDYAKAFKGRSL